MPLHGREAASATEHRGQALPQLNVLIVGHGCLPESGSETGIAWNWAWHLAARNRVWVITHGYFRQPIERYMHDHPRPNLRFIWVGPLGRWDPWNGTEPRGVRLHYIMWRRAVVAAARRLIATEPIDLVHHVGWSTISAPPLLWQTGKPFVWGPLGGGQVLPWRFLASSGRAAIPELLRTLLIAVLPWTPSLRSAVSQADLVLGINGETAAVLRKAGARHIPLMPDTGIPAALLHAPKTQDATAALTVIWAGRFEYWKGLPICLEVAKALTRRDVKLLVAGSGRLRGWAQRYVQNLGLHDRVTFLGHLSWEDVQRRLAEADLFLFTSLRDAFGTVNFEAMAKGCPVLCLNHNGVATHLPELAAIKVPVTTPQVVVREIARHIEALASDRARLRRMSEAAYSFAATQSWDGRALRMEQFYRQVLRQRTADQAIAAVG
jgi:glycosyltransferase involved in cell wall biosynthesis